MRFVPKLLTIADKQRNRQMRNDVDARAAISGVSWQEGQKMWRDKFGKKGAKLNLRDNTHLQQIYNLMGSGKKAASAPSAPAPAKSTPLMPTISQASKDYRAETQRLLDETTKARDEFRADEAARVKAQAIAASNQLRSSQTANLQIQPASQTPTTGGTQSFKRRKLNQFLTGISGMVNI